MEKIKVINGEKPQGKRGPKGPSKYTSAFIGKEADALLQYARTCEMIPFECEFASQRDYHSQRLSEWAKINEQFSEALKRFKDIQLHRILILGLANKINPAMAIFTLKNVAGWRDRQEFEHSGEVKGSEQHNIIILSGRNVADRSRKFIERLEGKQA